MRKFADIDLVRQTLKDAMPLQELIALTDQKFAMQHNIACNPIEKVNDHLYRKKCDLDDHPMDIDGTRDSTPSFTICPQKELWHCFGCGSHGDRFEYISKKLHVDHMESIQIVAQTQGVDLTPFYMELTVEEQAKINLFNQNSDARDVAHNALLDSDKALGYLKSRGITEESIETFQIGYAPPISNGIVSIFSSISNNVTLHLDRQNQFNDAILFPITDAMGRMRYFQSRPFNPLPGMKYMGANDTHPLFDETDRIFGFHIAKKKLHESGGRIVGVEGAPDTISCVQQGINAVGFLGTAINQNTFDLLDRYRVTELVMLLDGDKAGRDKSFKNAEKYLSLKTNVKMRIAIMPEGYDPEEYINKFGASELRACIEDSVYAIQYLIDSKWENAKSPTEKINFMNDIKPYMVSISDVTTRKIMLSYVSMKIGIDQIQVEDYYMQANAESAQNKLLYSIGGEEVLLGEVLRNPDFMIDLQMKFREDDWYLMRHKLLFKLFRSNKFFDIDSLCTIANNMGIDGMVSRSWLEYIKGQTGNIEFIMFDVEDKLIRRKSIEIIDKARANLMDTTYDSVSTIDSSLSNVYNVIHNKMDEKVFSSDQQADSAMRTLLERMKNPGQIIGYSFGPNFPILTRALLGLMTKSLTVVSANQSVGKTQICENFAMYQSVAEQIPVLWFSLEMDYERMTNRNLSILSGVSCTDIMTGNITIEEFNKVNEASIQLKNSPFYISERGHDLSEALSIARRYVITKGVKIIYVDYCQLQYVTDRKTDARHRELGWISKAWKQLANELDIAVILISQLSKGALSADTAEAEHASGSYEIAQDADNFITLKDKDTEEIERRGIEHGQITMNISKNRMGERSVLIDIYKDPPNYRMAECA